MPAAANAYDGEDAAGGAAAREVALGDGRGAAAPDEVGENAAA
ncbi:hypothetical protein ABIE67_007346 [Streptomyces sp. V4I8]